MFMNLFTKSSVSVFVTVLLSSCLDFWVTKNLTGRSLIGLRWWSSNDISSEEDLDAQSSAETKDEEKSWYFESYDFEVNNSTMDSSVFWLAQSSSAAFWSIFMVLKVLGLNLFWVEASHPGHARVHLLQSLGHEPLRLLLVQER